MEVVSDYDKLNDKANLGQILQNCIIDLEKPIMMSADNKLIKLSISDLRSFLIKNKQQSALIHQVESIELKSKQNSDYILLLEKICILIKCIFEVGDTKLNSNYKLYSLVIKTLTEEKFLEEKRNLRKKNKQKSTKFLFDTNFYNILPASNII